LRGRTVIEEIIGERVASGAGVVHFWSPSCAVHVEVGLFLSYWEDFWYPSDDNSVLVVPSLALRIEFTEERLSLYHIEQSSTY